MTARILHTADWQLGKPFRAIPGDAAAVLRRDRLDTVRRIAALATAREVDAVLVAGDVFDANHVASDVIEAGLDALKGYRGPWVMLPGNHDAYLAESVWMRIDRLGRPANLIVAARAEPLPLADGRLVVLPAPLTQRHTQDDLTAWMDAAETPTDALRVGLAHGSIRDLLPQAPDADNPIAPDRAARARLDYLALGDWHGTRQIDVRTWYAGTPEPDRFPQNDPGNVLLVGLEAPGAAVEVEKVATAARSWRTLRLDLAAAGEPAAVVAEALENLGDASRLVLALDLAGTVGFPERAAIEATLDRWRPRLVHLEVDDRRLVATPTEQDLARLDDGGIVGQAARRLCEQLRGGSEDGRADAELALRLLWATDRQQASP